MDLPQTVDLSPLTGPLVEIALTVLAVLATWVAKRLLTFLGLKNDDVTRQYVMAALDNGVAYAVAAARKNMQGRNTFEIRNDATRTAVHYMLANVPDGMKRLGLTEEKLAAIASAAVMKALEPPAPGTTEGTIVTTPQA